MFGLLYSLRRHYLGAFSLLHWISILCLVCVVLITLEPLGIHRFWRYFPLLLAFLLPVVNYWGYRHDYVAFTPQHGNLEPLPLPSRSQLKVRATGLFEVEGKFRRHTWLEASYRTFPSREHAVIATCPPSAILRIGRSRKQDDGMWYIFCIPRAIRKVQLGQVQFGRTLCPAVALTHSFEVPGRFRRRRTRFQDEVVYLSCEQKKDAAILAGDLQADNGLLTSRNTQGRL